jgi:TM2 domain-containing membrane protein YozV
MKCANHVEVDSVAFCGVCGKPICGECRKEVRGASYCESCLVERLQPANPSAAKNGATGAPIPGLALALGLIPGVGAIYNGQVLKAIAQVLIFGSLIGIGDRVSGSAEGLFGLATAVFYFYMVIDSYQTAKRKKLGMPVQEWFGLGDTKLNAPVGAALLIGLGTLFLLDNLGIEVFSMLGRIWPVGLIVLGVLMLKKRARSNGGGTSPPSLFPPEPPKQDPGSPGGPQSM